MNKRGLCLVAFFVMTILFVKAERLKLNSSIWDSRKEIRDHYNQLSLDFVGGFTEEFRVYDNGVVYRFVTRKKEKQVTAMNEEVAFRFNFGVSAWILDSQSYETNYIRIPLDVQGITEFKNSKN